jgi:DNA-binding transcriptional regulator YhcF (GntR family)
MGVRPALGVAEALSFLKETKGQVSWTAKDMAGALRIGAKEAARALALLQIQGYVKSAGGNQWLTTPEGEAVSGAKTPRYSRESVEQALRALKERITEFNRDSAQEYKVAEALAYGDFLNGSAQVQAADVGLRVARRNAEHGRQSVGRGGPESAVEQAALNALLRKLRGRTALLHPRPYEAWMSHRSHMKLL